jgi:hypothetical protein
MGKLRRWLARGRFLAQGQAAADADAAVTATRQNRTER